MPTKSRGKTGQALRGKRGAGTRQALLTAGLELFGEHGLAGTTTRMLAERSGANVAAIPYYFGSKDGLYLAVVEYIVERVRAHVGEAARDVLPLVERGDLTPDGAVDALESIIHAMASMFVESDEPKAWAQIIVREQARPTAAFDVLYEGQIKRTQGLIAALVAAYTGLDAAGDEVKLRTHALIGQVLGFLIARESLLRHLGTRQLNAGHIDKIRAILGAHVRACLDAPPIPEKGS